MKKRILIKTPQYEIGFEDLCIKEYQRINRLMCMIEDEFAVDLNDHPKLRGTILDISNFIKRLPDMVSEVI